MTRAMPALVVGLTALATTGLINAGFGLWWLSQQLFRAQPPTYDWSGALATSGVAAAVVLIAAMLARRLVGGDTLHSSIAPKPSGEPMPARIVVRNRS